jgi:hypothetical protein
MFVDFIDVEDSSLSLLEKYSYGFIRTNISEPARINHSYRSIIELAHIIHYSYRL